MVTAKPSRQICPICSRDDDVKVVFAAEEWVMTCESDDHVPFEWRPKSQYVKAGGYRSGIGVELGVYDDLLSCVHGGFAEYGVIEHRYSKTSPSQYRELVARYGHRAKSPSSYTASSFLGGSLGHLWREGSIVGKWGPATGYWSYNDKVGTYAPSGTPAEGSILSWKQFASDTLGVDPQSWPALGFSVES